MFATGKLVAFELFNGEDEKTYRDWASQAQPSRLSDLLGVVAIGQTVSRRNVSITLFSLELYAEGFAVHGRYRLEEGHPVLDDVRRRWEQFRRNDAEAAPSAADAMDDEERTVANLRILAGQPIARLEPTAVDDRGNRYQSGLFDGRGIGEEARFSYAFTPPLDPAARDLRIEIPTLRWLIRPPGEDPRIDGDSEPGPWTFSILLPIDA